MCNGAKMRRYAVAFFRIRPSNSAISGAGIATADFVYRLFVRTAGQDSLSYGHGQNSIVGEPAAGVAGASFS